ncbi:MAG TPA: MupA/Atu3671 family FMN-dependent luciferase-like monooxygenase, partial [Ktedonobacteraceae bacterium]|nr:MupA/Atu3671 family FMN-dependent luciferase-like monooxygenase [Ktedonobacteraceae bacterium]
MQFGLIFFASSEAPQGKDRYRLVIDSARFADRHGFSSVWIPERHFTQDGWLYPNPAVLQAAIARETERIQLRAGSVVMPLHDPIRVAEEWAMVDNLSGGRVGLSFASGWHPNDFVFFPERYNDRNEEMYRGIETVQKLWRGEAVQVKGGDGKLVDIRTYPTPVQPSLPTWITAAGNPKTFMRAGEIGANMLTHLYN